MNKFVTKTTIFFAPVPEAKLHDLENENCKCKPKLLFFERGPAVRPLLLHNSLTGLEPVTPAALQSIVESYEESQEKS